MKAMVLAAGLGTRLRPLTNDRPKALVEVAGRTMLEITLVRLRSFGIRQVIVNVHHFADTVIDYLKAKDSFGMTIEVSREDVLLDTGGGLKKAAYFLQDTSAKDEPFILHNVDVLSTIDLDRMVRFHEENQPLATLAVQDRPSSRRLLFDPQWNLCGRRVRAVEQFVDVAAPPVQARAFCGIHVISPRIFQLMAEEGVFSIITSYLNLAARGQRIVAFPADEYRWRDLGTPESLTQAEQEGEHFHMKGFAADFAEER
jgi:mannose-1-phosphate guanylyltransferase